MATTCCLSAIPCVNLHAENTWFQSCSSNLCISSGFFSASSPLLVMMMADWANTLSVYEFLPEKLQHRNEIKVSWDSAVVVLKFFYKIVSFVIAWSIVHHKSFSSIFAFPIHQLFLQAKKIVVVFMWWFSVGIFLTLPFPLLLHLMSFQSMIFL